MILPFINLNASHVAIMKVIIWRIMQLPIKDISNETTIKIMMGILILWLIGLAMTAKVLIDFGKKDTEQKQRLSLEQEQRAYEFYAERDQISWERWKNYQKEIEASKSQGLKDFERRTSK